MRETASTLPFEYSAASGAAPALIVSAHPDDEMVGMGGAACRLGPGVAIAFLTDGTPLDPRYFAAGHASPEAYRRLRRREARRAWRVHSPGARLYFAPFADQQLAFCLPGAFAWLGDLVRRVRPAWVFVPAYEGGHPDHDAANFLVARLALPRTAVWEYALYTAWRGEILWQRFPAGRNIVQRLSRSQIERKRAALACYASQRDTLNQFVLDQEALRPLPQHAYDRPARAEPSVYQRWGWPWEPKQICAQFEAFRL